MLRTVSRLASVVLILLVSCLAGFPAVAAQGSEDSGAPPQVKKPDAFYSGSVVESTETNLVVSKTVLGKIERRTFIRTTDTKIEGRLRAGSRVTVRYAAGDNGDTCILIVVRSGGAPAKKK
jgi:hypothetical protein